jgi:hypothetical protein
LPNRVWRERLLVVGLLLAVFATRAPRLDQPILENYVGRQVPTAMVARNLVRGSGFLTPRLDTGPFPNLFLVEPPIVAQVDAWLSRWSGLSLEPAGRLVSALATTLAAWGLFGLVRSRQGLRASTFAVIAFAAFPVTIRYGRAFQPDAFAMGCAVAGMWCLDRGGRVSNGIGGILLALGLAQKVTWSFVLVPICLTILRGRSWGRRIAPVLCLIPACCWYLYVGNSLVLDQPGSSTTSDNAANWLHRLAPDSLLDTHRYLVVGRDLLIRAFTPIGFLLCCLGLLRWKSADRLWTTWAIAAGATLLLLFGKLHHEYYWLMLAPPAAALAGLALDRIARRSAALGWMTLTVLVGVGCYQTRSTWTTPPEWRDALALGQAIQRHVPPGELVIAPEAVVYLGDRPGCRLEWETASARRAVNEWSRGQWEEIEDIPQNIVGFYRSNAGARFFADLESDPRDYSRARFHEILRSCGGSGVRILEEKPGRYLLVEFERPQSR